MVIFSWITWTALGAIFATALGLLLWRILSYKFFVIERQLVKGRKLLRRDKARLYRDKNNQWYWRLRKERNKEKKDIPLPPSEAIDITLKGKKFAEFYRFEDGQIMFIKDDSKIIQYPKEQLANIPKSIKSEEDIELREEMIKKWKEHELERILKESGAIATFKPFPTEHRQILISNYRQAHGRRKPKILDYIPMIAGLSAIVIIAVSLMIFYGEIAEPVINANKQWIEIRQIDLKIVEILEGINRNVQNIAEQPQNINGTGPPN